MAKVRFVTAKNGELCIALESIIELIDEGGNEAEDEVRDDFSFFGPLSGAPDNYVAATNRIMGVMHGAQFISAKFQELELKIEDRVDQIQGEDQSLSSGAQGSV